ncbi:hypothetical protein [Clostridium porci]|uniref:Uncharacterized protein n=1 Tax=Clostridium porci TaxID=2605778 RepID=A0A7X2NPB5_9CLOT|nr:hypothetical protein [Clostridium porci]MSS38582.1 hypothetical protein [Clostridium porci]
MKYDAMNLQMEDAYDDSDYPTYETMEYSNEEDGVDEELTAPQPAKGRKNRKKNDNVITIDEYDFYKTTVKVDRGEVSKQRYAALAKAVLSDDETVCKAAREEACYYMKGLVREFIRKKYRTYIDKDPDFASDLEQEAYANIIKYLPEYDASKGEPSTFFYYHIKSAIAGATNAMKHQVSSADTALKRKIMKINKIYEEFGRKPTLGDYMAETNETMSKIRSVLAMMSTDMNTHLEAIPEYDQLIAGDAHVNRMFESPENIVIKNMTFEAVVQRLNAMFTKMEVDIFMRYTYHQEPIPSIAKSFSINGDDKIRRIIEKVKHGIQYDPQARAAYFGSIGHPQASVVEFLPIESTNEAIDLLSAIAL